MSFLWYMEKQDNIKPTAMNKSQLADLYHIGVHTLNVWLKPFQKEIGEYRGRAYTPNQIRKIFELLGQP